MGYVILCEDPKGRVSHLWRTKSLDYGHVYDDPIECGRAVDLLNESVESMELTSDLLYSMGAHDAID